MIIDRTTRRVDVMIAVNTSRSKVKISISPEEIASTWRDQAKEIEISSSVTGSVL